MIKVILFLLFIVTTYAKCPPDAGAALLDDNRIALVECDEKTLREYYRKDDCCIVNIAECNNIAAAFALRRNVYDPTPLCPQRWIRGMSRH